ncbi:10321_t:CDS:2 [Acaulospora colombiana]|uniref:10321_t:CDS:1 n=1 Tax=Acaulospora colombiana TaxID=27376 RepID=A0ACA9N8T7_9GLOM|nr:10321_t:CDS:2 [Acaulospora colombiana]
MPFGEIVIGAPGAGKSTYAYGKYQLFTALQRPIAIVNLDPANDNLPYPCEISISSLITLQDAMEEFGLGPNGAMLYCIEYLEQNFDWLLEKLKALGGGGSQNDEVYVMFDLPGQVELSTNHESLKNIVDRLLKNDFRLAAVNLCDVHYVTDAAKYISVLLLSLRTMLQLELPHINVLSKIDLLSQYGDLDFNLDFYTEVQDLSYLENSLPQGTRFSALNMRISEMVQDFGLDRESMLRLMRIVDRATGCIFVPPSTVAATQKESSRDDKKEGIPVTQRPNIYSLFTTAAGAIGGVRGDVRDVQERWLEAKDEWDEHELEQRKEEAAALKEMTRSTM